MQPPTEIASGVLPRPEAATAKTTPGAGQLEALRARQSAAWARLYDEYSPVVFRSALAQVGDRALAEDITAQVFLEAIEGIGRYRDSGRPIEAWLLTIARHRAIDAVRRKKRQAVLPVAEPALTAGAGPALEALSVLTPEQREVIHLRFVEDRSIEEVAALTRRSPGAVKSLQHRALKQLRARLENQEHRGIHHA